MDTYSYSDSVFVSRPVDEVYELVADVTRMGEWSPVCKACWWDDDTSRGVGAWFTGRNERPERTWETRCQVVAAEPAREFAFMVGGEEAGRVRWAYTFAPVDGGTELSESWNVLPGGVVSFQERFGENAEKELEQRAEAARSGIPETLAAIKRAAEAK